MRTRKAKTKRKVRWMIFRIFCLLLMAYFLFVVAGCLFQNRIAFVPYRTLKETPANWGLTYEDVFLKTDDGTQIHGWYCPAPEAKWTLLCFHGNAGNLSHRGDTFRFFHELGLNVFMIDYRGYGRSEGKPSEQGVYADASACWQWLTEQRQVDADSIIIFGRSLGGAVACWLAKKHTPAGLILESTFTSIKDYARKKLPIFPRFLLNLKFDTAGRLLEVHCPVLIIHSPEDEIIPYEFGQELYEIANEPKTFLQIEGSHNGGYFESKKIYLAGIKRFIDDLPHSR